MSHGLLADDVQSGAVTRAAEEASKSLWLRSYTDWIRSGLGIEWDGRHMWATIRAVHLKRRRRWYTHTRAHLFWPQFILGIEQIAKSQRDRNRNCNRAPGRENAAAKHFHRVLCFGFFGAVTMTVVKINGLGLEEWVKPAGREQTTGVGS